MTTPQTPPEPNLDEFMHGIAFYVLGSLDDLFASRCTLSCTRGLDDQFVVTITLPDGVIISERDENWVQAWVTATKRVRDLLIPTKE